MLHQILALADHLDIRCIWGEATEHSCGWYQDHLAIKEVRDHFFIEDDVMEHCQKERLKAVIPHGGVDFGLGDAAGFF